MGSPLLVLLADDDEELRFILARVLKKEGYEVEEMGNFGALLSRLSTYSTSPMRERETTVLVSDVFMPGGTALEAVERLGDRLAKLPIVFITSARDSQITEQGMNLGARAVLSKPVDMNELKRLMKEIADAIPNGYRVDTPLGAN